MARNRVIKTFDSDGTWVAPAGVKEVLVKVVQDNPQKIDTGSLHSISLDRNQLGITWGYNVSGQLGQSNIIDRSSPVSVVGARTFISVGTCAETSFGIDLTGDAYGWGRAVFGELGDNTTADKSSPIILAGGHKWRLICSGDNGSNSGGVLINGDAYTWGNNTNGKLGNNTTTNSSSPIIIAGSQKFKQLALSSTGGAGIVLNSDAYAWNGSNASGQVGDNTTIARSSPVLVVGGLKFNRLSCGNSHTLGLTTSGDIYAWGSNTSGQLGDNTTANRSSPVLVLGGLKFRYVSAGFLTSAAITTTGDLYTWGDNTSGALGQNDATNKSSPVLVVGGNKYSTVTISSEPMMMAMRPDGSIFTWGSNTFGHLGDNTTADRSSPVLVVGPNIYKANYENVFSTRYFPVTPGTSYAIVTLSATPSFDATSLGTVYGITKIQLEYDI